MSFSHIPQTVDTGCYCSQNLSHPFLQSRRLVIDTLTEASKADPDRKCFRLIGGVLVERTVKEVLPALQTNLEGVSVSPLSYCQSGFIELSSDFLASSVRSAKCLPIPMTAQANPRNAPKTVQAERDRAARVPTRIR